MARVKGGKIFHKRKKNLLAYTKGFRWGRKSKLTLAREALFHAWKYAYRDRRTKKREFRQLWQIKINAACRQSGLSYSKFMNQLKKQNIIIDRKILSQLACDYPEIFLKIISKSQEVSPKSSN